MCTSPKHWWPPVGSVQKANKKPKGTVNTRKCKASMSLPHKPQPYVSFLYSFPRTSLAPHITSAPLCTFLLHQPSGLNALHKSVAPRNENPTTTKPMIIGVLSRGWRDGAALFLPVEVLDAPVATAVTDPEPEVAVPVEVPPAF